MKEDNFLKLVYCSMAFGFVLWLAVVIAVIVVGAHFIVGVW